MENSSEIKTIKGDIVKKAYTLDLSRIYNGHLYSEEEFVVHDITSTSAKMQIQSKLLYEDLRLTNSSKVTYLNMPIIRCKKYDLILYNGKAIPRHKKEHEMQKKLHNEQLDIVLADNNITHCYIVKRGSYYCDGYCGYTDIRSNAGVYPKLDAVQHIRGVYEAKLISINNKEHNEEIQTQIALLQKRILPE